LKQSADTTREIRSDLKRRDLNFIGSLSVIPENLWNLCNLWFLSY
jgi:hypothetical protein